jgi:hypothetical protein
VKMPAECTIAAGHPPIFVNGPWRIHSEAQEAILRAWKKNNSQAYHRSERCGQGARKKGATRK